jgi:hypothetical protein
MSIFHFFQLFFEIHNGLLTIIFVIVFFGEVSKDFLVNVIFFELFLSDLVDLVHGFLDGVFIVLIETEKVLNVFIFGVMPERDTLLDSVFGEFFNVLRFLVGRHCFDFLFFLSHSLSLFNFVVKLALDFRNSFSLDFLVKDHCAVFACFNQAALCLLRIDFVEFFFLSAHDFGFIFHAELCKNFVCFGL